MAFFGRGQGVATAFECTLTICLPKWANAPDVALIKAYQQSHQQGGFLASGFQHHAFLSECMPWSQFPGQCSVPRHLFLSSTMYKCSCEAVNGQSHKPNSIPNMPNVVAVSNQVKLDREVPFREL